MKFSNIWNPANQKDRKGGVSLSQSKSKISGWRAAWPQAVHPCSGSTSFVSATFRKLHHGGASLTASGTSCIHGGSNPIPERPDIMALHENKQVHSTCFPSINHKQVLPQSGWTCFPAHTLVDNYQLHLSTCTQFCLSRAGIIHTWKH